MEITEKINNNYVVSVVDGCHYVTICTLSATEVHVSCKKNKLFYTAKLLGYNCMLMNSVLKMKSVGTKDTGVNFASLSQNCLQALICMGRIVTQL